MAAVTLENLTISYDRHPAVHHISGEFAPGSLTAIAGPNGAGKSTLLKGIAGVLTPEEGYINISDCAKLAYLPQAAEIMRDFPVSVLHLVTTGFWHGTGAQRSINGDMKKKAADALAEVGLEGFGPRDIASLSSGQFQRALFARLIVQDSQLILLDEPFTAIDAGTTKRLIEIILGWHKEGRTVICVLHDFEQIRQFFPQCLLLARECVAWGESPDVLKPENIMGSHFFREGWKPGPEICERTE